MHAPGITKLSTMNLNRQSNRDVAMIKYLLISVPATVKWYDTVEERNSKFINIFPSVGNGTQEYSGPQLLL